MRVNDGMAIVTGGRGIGQAAAVALASEGVAIAAVARTEPEVEQTAARIRASGGEAVALVADVAHPDTGARVLRAAEEQLGRPCSILVNAAGITGPVGELSEIDLPAVRQTLAINLTGPFAMCRATW